MGINGNPILLIIDKDAYAKIVGLQGSKTSGKKIIFSCQIWESFSK